MNRVLLFGMGLILSFSNTTFAAVLTMQEVLTKANSVQTARIIERDGLYLISIVSVTYFTSKGIPVYTGSIPKERYFLKREIELPVNITLRKIGGGGEFYQFIGFGDDDLKTGSFSNLNDGRIGDLLTSFKGRSTNIGLTLIGGGYSSVTSEKGIKMSEGNGSLFFIGPVGTPIGINTGFRFLKYELVIHTPLRAALVKYSFHGAYGNDYLTKDSSEVVLSMDEVLNLPMTLK